MREYNLHGNRKACSRDIARRFAKFEALNLVCSGANIPGSGRLLNLVTQTNILPMIPRCGRGLQELMKSCIIKHQLTGDSMRDLNKEKDIFAPGCLRKVRNLTKEKDIFAPGCLRKVRNLTILSQHRNLCQGYTLCSLMGAP